MARALPDPGLRFLGRLTVAAVGVLLGLIIVRFVLLGLVPAGPVLAGLVLIRGAGVRESIKPRIIRI